MGQWEDIDVTLAIESVIQLMNKAPQLKVPH